MNNRPPPSAAQALYGHLKSGVREPIKQRTNSLADSMFPSLSREQKAKQADQARWDALNKRNRDNLLKHLREANASLVRRGR
jgi:hypothetical protein